MEIGTNSGRAAGVAGGHHLEPYLRGAMNPVIIQPAEGTVRVEIVNYTQLIGDGLALLCIMFLVYATRKFWKRLP